MAKRITKSNPDDVWMKHTITEMSTDIREIRREQGNIRSDIAGLKVRAGLWGGLAGILGGAVGFVASLVK